MEFIKGIPMTRQRGPGGKYYYAGTKNEAYINPSAIASAVFDPNENMTAIRMIGVENGAVLKGDVMREYEERVRRQAGDGRDD